MIQDQPVKIAVYRGIVPKAILEERAHLAFRAEAAAEEELPVLTMKNDAESSDWDKIPMVKKARRLWIFLFLKVRLEA